jgi:hypothetical protein
MHDRIESRIRIAAVDHRGDNVVVEVWSGHDESVAVIIVP